MKYFIHNINEERLTDDLKLEIDFDTASKHLVNLSYNEKEDDNPYFIGFENGESCIQFMRSEKGFFLFDAPIIENEEYVYSYTKDKITEEEAIKILKFFFEGKNWMGLQNFEKEYPESEHEDDEEEETSIKD